MKKILVPCVLLCIWSLFQAQDTENAAGGEDKESRTINLSAIEFDNGYALLQWAEDGQPREALTNLDIKYLASVSEIETAAAVYDLSVSRGCVEKWATYWAAKACPYAGHLAGFQPRAATAEYIASIPAGGEQEADVAYQPLEALLRHYNQNHASLAGAYSALQAESQNYKLFLEAQRLSKKK